MKTNITKKEWKKPEILNVLPIKQTKKPTGTGDGAGGSAGVNKNPS